MTVAKNKDIFTHTISLLVANKPGVLVRIAIAFARRGFNIDSLTVSPSSNEKFSRMTITAQGDPQTLEQIIHQANKLIDVVHAWEHNDAEAVHSELALFKVRKKSGVKAALTRESKAFGVRVIDETAEALILEQCGSTEELDRFEKILKKHGIVEMVRTGKVIMVKGLQAT